MIDNFNDKKNNKISPKCNKHLDQKIHLICLICNKPLCLSCIVCDNHINHQSDGNKIGFIDKGNIYPILAEFKQYTLKNLIGYQKSDEKVLDHLNNINNNNNKITLEKERVRSFFEKIHSKLDTLKKNISLNFEKKELYININRKRQIQAKYKLIYKIPVHKKEENKKNLEVNKLTKFNNELLYYSHGETTFNHKKIFMDKNANYEDIYINDGIKEIHFKGPYKSILNEKLKNVKKVYLHDINNLNIEEFKINADLYICFKKEDDKFISVKQQKVNNKVYFTLNKENIDFIDSKIIDQQNKIALGDMGSDELLLRKKVNILLETEKEICCQETFNYNLEYLFSVFKTIKKLSLYNNKNIRLETKFPQSIKELSLMDGFNQPLEKELLSKSLTKISFYKVGNILKKDSLASSNLQELCLMNGFNQPLENGLIPENIKILHLSNIGSNVLSYSAIPDSINKVYLKDGFNQKLYPGFIPFGVEYLYLYNIGENVLEIGSIPQSVKYLYLCDGVNQTFGKSMIPDSVELLSLSKIGKKVLNNQTIPSCCKTLILNNGFGQRIINGIVPDTIQYIDIYDIDSHLLFNGSFPNGSLRKLSFNHGYNQIIEKDLIPKCVKKLYLHSGKKILHENGDSIPSTIETLIITKGFSQKLFKGLIPNNIKTLKLQISENIFLNDSLPDGVEKIFLLNDFNIPISYIKTQSFFELHIRNIGENVLKNGTLPNNIRILYLHDGFNQLLSEGSIPDGVKDIHLYDIGPNAIQNGSIPYSVESIYIHDGFSQTLTKGMISGGVKLLHLYNIGPNVLVDGSIPDNVKKLILQNGFNQPLYTLITINQLDVYYILTKRNPMKFLNDPFFNNYQTIKSLIPGSVETLELYNIGPNVLVVGSIPDNVKKLILQNGFNQPLYTLITNPMKNLYDGIFNRYQTIKSLIPGGVETLELYNIGPNVLSEESLPATLKSIQLQDGFNQRISDHIIPFGTELFYLSKVILPGKSFYYIFDQKNKKERNDILNTLNDTTNFNSKNSKKL